MHAQNVQAVQLPDGKYHSKKACSAGILWLSGKLPLIPAKSPESEKERLLQGAIMFQKGRG